MSETFARRNVSEHAVFFKSKMKYLQLSTRPWHLFSVVSTKHPPTNHPSDVVSGTAQPQTSAKSTIKYKMQIDGGEVNVYPLISLKLPLTQFSGTQSSELGVFLETCLERLQVQFGESPSPTWSHQSGTLDLQQLAALPEGVRLRILLCLKDLKPLEKALSVEKDYNSFLRCKPSTRAW